MVKTFVVRLDDVGVNTYHPLTGSAAHLPTAVVGKALVGSRLAAVRRRRVRAGSSQSSKGGKGNGGELHVEGLF